MLQCRKNGKLVDEIKKIGYSCNGGTISVEIPSMPDGARIDETLITEDANFIGLYDLWIKAGIYCMGNNCQKSEEELVEESENCFFYFTPEANGTDGQKDFRDAYCNDVSEVVSGGDLFPEQFYQPYCDSIDQSISEKYAHIKLRVLAVCLVVQRQPQELFTGGEQWSQMINAQFSEKDYKEVRQNDIFTMDFCVNSNGRLIPRTLRNPSDVKRLFTIKYEKEVAKIELPPYGILRAVFGDKECTKLVSVKRNITSYGHRKLRQYGGKDGIKLDWIEDDKKYDCSHPKDFFVDVSWSVDGQIFKLLGNELQLGGKKYDINQEKDGLPIRCYSAEGIQAFLYENGNLIVRLQGELDDYKWEGVTAVVECGEEGLLIYQNNKIIPIKAFGAESKEKMDNTAFFAKMIQSVQQGFPKEE